MELAECSVTQLERHDHVVCDLKYLDGLPSEPADDQGQLKLSPYSTKTVSSTRLQSLHVLEAMSAVDNIMVNTGILF